MMNKNTMEKTVCLAYFVDGRFVGWYSDTFGSVTPQSPKLYSYSERQVEIIFNNFTRKMNKIKETSFAEQSEKVEGLQALSLLVFEGEEVFRGKNVELRMVECPIYDGPNPDFNEEEHARLVKEREDKMRADGVFDIPAPSAERSMAVAKYPRIQSNRWIYADYSKVKEWASQEPNEFLNICVFQV